MKHRIALPAVACLLAGLFLACAGAATNGGSTDRDRITAEELATVDVPTLHDVVQRLRPRWLEVRSARSGFAGGTETEVLVYMGRTLLGGVDQLRSLGSDVAVSLEYMTGSAAAAALPGIQHRHVEGVIIVHTAGGR